ncbi:MAG: sigma-54-dependent Fis family transcriptional regulator [Deltaproteobacteria bacterium]|nr:sigma-54-dependent Fis family transcriptional regulator [Deltaproteobacteria bacterium]MBK8234298.1 sigma-54-dependent Fis family transcriptional regulator [Deltaproteobacteria bacterium]MBK8715022.1 sigma-54-dependent Fis family transcriptional regulator [Deltaproteobacteria bacterium]MBP7287037.1 sigma-54-dependent Fis family transcriptional regulator [Nannocystaceae bacterium]
MTEQSNVQGASILVVDDEPAARSALVELLREEGFVVRSAADGFKALGQLDDWTPDLIVTDVKMPGMDGIELMKKVRERFEGTGVVVMTAYGSVEHAVSAMQLGADDYLTKPVHFPELLVVVRRVLASYELRRENVRLKTALVGEGIAPGLEWIGQSKQSRELLGLVRQVADSDASVLILGESGTGKELVARALHAWSRRKQAPFVAVHCAALNEGVLESELFGHEKGAFTGATARRDGRFLKADGGTLLLDEVGDIPMSTQVKLLRVLQERQFEPVGSDTPVSVDVRVIASTHRDLHREVREGRFREDLFYRLNVITLRTPPLAQRREDIPALSMHFLERYASKSRKLIRGFSDRALRVLLSADWPGNVRQLENCIERAVVLCQGHEIEPRHLPRDIMVHARMGDETPPIPGSSMADIEKFAILKTLEHVRGSTSKAAEILGISPRKIQYRLAEYRGESPPAGSEHDGSRASD